MSITPCCLLAYDADDNVIATLDYVVSRDADGSVVGLVDFAGHEEAGGEMLDVWAVEGAAGSKVWPEFLSNAAHDFKVERVGPPGNKRIAALVHKTSGHRRVRQNVERAIGDRIVAAAGGPADIRDIVGGYSRPLSLDDEGRTVARPVSAGNLHLPQLPVVGGDPLPVG